MIFVVSRFHSIRGEVGCGVHNQEKILTATPQTLSVSGRVVEREEMDGGINAHSIELGIKYCVLCRNLSSSKRTEDEGAILWS